jgi:DNA-binding response OmpR family regulator
VGLIVLSSTRTLEHKLTAFEAGADDYIETPCDPKEIVARAKAVVRRSSRPPCHVGMQPANDAAAPMLELRERSVPGPNGRAELTPTELRLLQLLATNGAEGVPTERLALEVLSRYDIHARNLVHRHVSNLRRKLERVGLAGAIHRSRNGYLLSASVHWLGRQAMRSVQT